MLKDEIKKTMMEVESSVLDPYFDTNPRIRIIGLRIRPDPDPTPALFFSGFQDTKKLYFLCLPQYGTYHRYIYINRQRYSDKSQHCRKKDSSGFLYDFVLF
jgi:hypothetical protein